MPIRSVRSRLCFALTASFLLSSLSASAQQILPVANVPAKEHRATAVVISQDDLLEVVVFDVPELSRDVRVTAEGTVAFPLLPEPLKASGLTVNDFRDSLAAELRSRGLVSDPRVSISLKQSPAHSVAITGAVRNPQIYPLMTEGRLLDVLSQAGGLADNAGSTVHITRGRAATAHSVDDLSPKADDTTTITVDLKQLLEGGSAALNLPVYPGDWITVPVAGIVYVVGAVNRPGGFPLNLSHQHLTVLQALALAEDAKTTALRDQAIVVRRGSQYPNGRQEIPVRIGHILAGSQPDLTLQANDILFVPDSAGKRAFLRGAEAAIQIATGIAIWHH